MISEMVRPFGLSLARRATRRWLVAGYWIVVCAWLGLALWCAWDEGNERHTANFVHVLWLLFFVPPLLGGVKHGGLVKPYRGVRWASLQEQGSVSTLFGKSDAQATEEALDERERNERDRMHFVAYTVARWLTLAMVVLFAGLSAWNFAWGQHFGAVCLCVLALVFWSLPQSLILWNEPDVEVEP
jgi:hypothetical protein